MPHAGHTSSNADIEILAIDAVTWIPLMLAQEYDQDGTPKPKQMVDSQMPQGAEQSTYKRLEILTQEDWFGGVGVSYNVAPGVYTRTRGYALPAGFSTDLTIPAGNTTSTPIAAIEEYGGDLWCLQIGTTTANTPRVMRSTSKTGALADSLNVGANNALTDLLVFDNGSGTKYLWASGNDAAGGRLHYWNGAAWTSTASGTFGTNRRDWLAKVQWTIDGVSAWRMIAGNGPNTISYTKPNSDPALAASWVEGVKVETAGTLRRAATARKHAYVPSQDGLFDLDEAGNTPNLTSYTAQMQHPYNGFASLYLDGYVYVSLGQGLDRVYVGDGPILQENVGQCAPGWGTPAEHEYRGWTTALAPDQGYVVNAIFNPSTLRAAIWWGKDRRVMGVDTPNPLVWYGPEVVGNENQLVTAMRTVAINDGVNNSLRLYVASIPYAPAGVNFWGGVPALSWISLPLAGAPLDDLISVGQHRVATGSGSGRWQASSRLQLLKTGFRDRVDYKILHQHGFTTRGILGTATSKMILETRADPTPGQTTWTTSDDVTASPQDDITPSVVTAGYLIDRRISFLSASSSAPVVLDAIRTTAWEAVPAFGVRPITVTYGDGVRDNYGAPLAADIEPHDITIQLDSLTRGRKTTLRDRNGRRWTVKLEQVMDRVETLGDGPYGVTVVCKLEVSFMEQLD